MISNMQLFWIFLVFFSLKTYGNVIDSKENISFVLDKTNISNINEDCQVLILQKLNLKGLVNVYETNKHFQSLALGVFRRKYGNQLIEFHQIDAKPDNDFNNTVKIHELDFLLKVLKYFGQFISKLTINFLLIDLAESKKIMPTIVEFTSDSLQKLHLIASRQNLLAEIRRPFKNVEDVHLSGKFDKMIENSLELNEIFPKMQRLILGNMQIFNKSCIILKYPHLLHMEISFANLNGLTEVDIEAMFNMNTQINSLNVRGFSMEFLKRLNNNLPKLETLEIPSLSWDYNHYEGDDIHFDTVKKFIVKGKPNQAPEIILFSQLRELEVEFAPDFFNQWSDYIVKFENLTNLNIVKGVFCDAQILTFIGKLTKLVEASLICGPDVEVETIIKFVKTNIQLKILRLESFPMINFSQIIKEEIRNELGATWNLRENIHGHILVERN